MAPKKGAEALLDLCSRATILGNTVSVRMLEYLSTVKHLPHGFKELANDFLDISRILFSIEAGLAETSRAQTFPQEMVLELDKKFRQTHDEFVVLNQMLLKYIDYEHKATGGGFGKLSKGWKMRYADSDIAKIRDSLSKSREALRMSALVFRWSLGDDKADAAVGIGFTGLAAALDRMNNINQLHTQAINAAAAADHPSAQEKQEIVEAPRETRRMEPELLDLPPRLSPIQMNAEPGLLGVASAPPRVYKEEHHKPREHVSREDFRHYSSLHSAGYSPAVSGNAGRDERLDHHGRHSPQVDHFGIVQDNHSSLHDHGSHHHPHPERISQHTTSLRSGRGGVPSQLDHLTHDIRPSSRTMHYGTDGGSDDGFKFSPRAQSAVSPHTSTSDTAIDDLVHDVDAGKMNIGPITRLKVDPMTVPRWTPRHSSGGSSIQLKNALVTAVEKKQHKVIEELLDRGVTADSGSNDVNLLREAVLNDDPESIRLLLLFGAEPNAFDKDSWTALFTAAELGSMESAKMLIKYGADPNLSAGPEAESPLAFAVVENRVDFVQLFLTYGGDPNHVMANGNTVLVRAMNKKTHVKMVELLLGYGSNPNGKSGEGKTPLFEAIGSSRVDLVTMLLDAGADPNLPGPKHVLWPATYEPSCLKVLLARGADPKKCPGIMELATSINNIDSVRVLLQAGVDPNAKNDGTYTPLCSAIRDNRHDIVTLLLANGADANVPASEYPAFKCVTHHRAHFLPQLVAAGAHLDQPKGIVEKAIAHGNKEALAFLLDQGVNPNERGDNDNTPLTSAIRDEKVDLVELLLEKGADPAVRGDEWPVNLAVSHPAILKLLLQYLPDPRAFKGVVERAVVAGSLESVKMLLAAGLSVEDRNGGVFSPLTSAIREDRRDMVRYLLDEAGADVNSPGEHLPLVKAIRRHRGHETEVIEMLLVRGADINLMYRGWNAVMQAVENADADVLRILIAKGNPVDLSARDDAGRSIMEIITSRGFDEATSILAGGNGGAEDRRASMFSTASWGSFLNERGEHPLGRKLSNSASFIASSDEGDLEWDRRRTTY